MKRFICKHRAVSKRLSPYALAVILMASWIVAPADSAVPLITFHFGNNYGVVDITGKIIVEPNYESFRFGPTLITAIKGKKYYLIDRQGQFVGEPSENYISECEDSGFVVAGANGKAGYLDAQRNVVIAAKYDSMGCFGANGLAIVWKDDRIGMVNRKGEIVVPIKFHPIDTGQSVFGKAIVVTGEKGMGLLSSDGKLLVEPTYREIREVNEKGLAPVSTVGGWGLLDVRTQKIAPKRYDWMGRFSKNGLAPIRIDGKYGYIDSVGNVVIRPQFDNADGFTANNLARVTQSRKYGFIDTKGQYAIEPRYFLAKDFGENGLAPACLSNWKCGYIDNSGTFVIAPRFSLSLFQFAKDGSASVELWGSRGSIDRNGDLIALTIKGCGKEEVLGKGNKVIWAPKGQLPIDLDRCVVWPHAIENLDLDVIKSLLGKGYRPEDLNQDLVRVTSKSVFANPSDPDYVDEFNSRQIEVVKTLVKHGASPDAGDPNGNNPPLLSAIRHNNDPLALALIQLGANTRTPTCDVSKNKFCDRTTVIFAAIQWQAYSTVTAMLEHDFKADDPDSKGLTPLGWVLKKETSKTTRDCYRMARETKCETRTTTYDRQKWLRLLLDHGADANRVTEGVRPLMASEKGDMESIILLRKHGAKMAAPVQKFGLDGEMREIGPITWAILHERNDLLPIALEEAGRTLDKRDDYAIVLAARQNRYELVSNLLHHGANANFMFPQLGVTLLHEVAGKGKVDVARALLAGGAEINAPSVAPVLTKEETGLLLLARSKGFAEGQIDTGVTPLMAAAGSDQVEMVKFLLANGASVALKTKNGRTAESFTTNTEILGLLQERARRH